MFTVSDIAKNKQNVALIERYFNFSLLQEGITERKKAAIKSNSMIGTVIEQYILTHQYKYNKKSNLQYEITDYKQLIKSWKIKYLELDDILKVDNFNIKNETLYCCKDKVLGSVVIFHDSEKMKNTYPYSIVNKSNPKIFEDAFLFNFIDDFEKFSFIKSGHVYYFQYNQLLEIISKGFRKLIKDVYSKKQASDIEIIKLLYFQNIIINWPYYLRGAGPTLDAYNLHKLFNNYDEEIKNLVDVIANSKTVINKIGDITSYQESVEFNRISGRVDFLTNDSIIEIKTSSILTKKELCQVLLYMLISKANNSKLKYFKLVYPFKNLIYEYDIDLVLSQLIVTPDYLLNEIAQLHEKTINEKKEFFLFELRKKLEKEEELRRKKEHKKEVKRQEKIKEKAKVKQQIIKDKEKKELLLSRKKEKLKLKQ